MGSIIPQPKKSTNRGELNTAQMSHSKRMFRITLQVFGEDPLDARRCHIISISFCEIKSSWQQVSQAAQSRAANASPDLLRIETNSPPSQRLAVRGIDRGYYQSQISQFNCRTRGDSFSYVQLHGFVGLSEIQVPNNPANLIMFTYDVLATNWGPISCVCLQFQIMI